MRVSSTKIIEQSSVIVWVGYIAETGVIEGTEAIKAGGGKRFFRQRVSWD
jgi:hypothetical protein